jgi:hypothetical protein
VQVAALTIVVEEAVAVRELDDFCDLEALHDASL